MEIVKSLFYWLLVTAAVCLAVMPLSAHHAIQAKFDPARTRSLNGVVTGVDWRNPHVHVLMNVVDSGQMQNWAVELDSVIDLERSGWNRESLKPGDRVRVEGIVARDGSLQVWGNSVVHTGSGRQVYRITPEAEAFLKPMASSAPRPSPRWPDGQPRLGPVPGEKGYWARPSSTLLMETGAN